MRRRVLILSGVVPAIGRGGGCIALHRHFVERHDFEVAAAGLILNGVSVETVVSISPGRVMSRLQRTRFRRFFVNLQILWSWIHLPRELAGFISSWRPDIIFTVPDNQHLGVAWLASRRFKIPLAVNFQDLFPVSHFVSQSEQPYGWVSRFLMRRFELVDRHADAVFYTSEGMQEWFSGQLRGHILYPLGATPEVRPAPVFENDQLRTVIYAGNCYGAYGRMLLQLCRAIQKRSDICLRIFTAGNDWSTEDRDHFRQIGVLCDFLPFEQLRYEFDKASAFLTVMSFDLKEKPFVSTSFTTKWLDYAPFGKPVFVWAPHYSSAATFARRNDCGAVIDANSAEVAAAELARLLNEKNECSRLGEASLRVANTLLNSDRIHSLFVQTLSQI